MSSSPSLEELRLQAADNPYIKIMMEMANEVKGLLRDEAQVTAERMKKTNQEIVPRFRTFMEARLDSR